MNRLRSIAFALACTTAVSSLWVCAQNTPAPAAVEPKGDIAPMETGHKEYHEGLLGVFKRLSQDLKLSPEQAAALDKVVKNFQAQLKKGQKQHQEAREEGKTPLTALQRMERHVQFMDEHAQQAKSNLEDFKHFYGLLKLDQQKKVDEVFARIHHHVVTHKDHQGYSKAKDHRSLKDGATKPASSSSDETKPSSDGANVEPKSNP